MRMGNVENLPPCAEIGDPYGGAASSLCPVPNHRKGHVLHVIVGEKDPFRLLRITWMARLEVSQTFALSLPLGVAMWISTMAF